MKLSTLSVRDLRRELERREKGSKRLVAHRAKLSKRLAELDAELAELGVEVAPLVRRGRRPGPKPGRKPGRPAGRRGGRRAKGGMTLIEALEKAVLVGKTVSPREAAAAVKKVGYASTSKTFGVVVASALTKASGFKKVGHGQYARLGARARPVAQRVRAKVFKRKAFKKKSGSDNTGPRHHVLSPNG